MTSSHSSGNIQTPETSTPLNTLLHPKYATHVLGHEVILNKLLSAFFAKQRIHHAVIISGTRGIGKATLVYRLIKLIFSNQGKQQPLISDAVDVDSRDFELLLRNNHPDVLVLETDMEKQITIEQMRDMLTFTNMQPTRLANKIVIIDSINDLNSSSANAMLKALEEPQGSTMFFLIHHDEKDILPTVRSRCTLVKVPKISCEHTRAILQNLPLKIPQDLLLPLAIIANKNPSSAVRLFLSNGMNIYQKMLQIIAKELDYYDLAKEMYDNSDAQKLVTALIERFLYICLMASTGVKIDMMPAELDAISKYLRRNNLIDINMIQKTENILSILHQWNQSHLQTLQVILTIFRELMRDNTCHERRYH